MKEKEKPSIVITRSEAQEIIAIYISLADEAEKSSRKRKRKTFRDDDQESERYLRTQAAIFQRRLLFK
jgi:hypothetical protein